MEGPALAADLATRWESYLSSGIDKESRKKLIEQYNVPTNCKYLKAPTLNPEVEALMSPADIKKDKFLTNLQEILGKGITAGGEALTKILAHRDTVDATATQALVDSGKLLTDIFQTLSTHRKYQTYKYFNVSVQKIATQQNVDASLFGIDFADKCKSAKSIVATAKELQKPGPSNRPQAAARNLNLQRPPFRKRTQTEGRRGGERYGTDFKQRQKAPREYKKATDYKYSKANRR